MKKHICLTTYDSLTNPYYGGGGALAVHNVAKGLTRWYQVTVLAGKYPGSKSGNIDGVEYLYIGSQLHPMIDQLTFTAALPGWVKKIQPDLVIESFTPPFSASNLPNRVSIPVVGLVHMLAGRDMQRKYHLPFTWIENHNLKNYQHIIVLSEYWRQLIESVNPSASYHLIPNSIPEIRHSRPLPSSDNKYILFMGRIEVDQKGLDLLINAWQYCNHEYKLYIVGKGSTNNINRLYSLIKNSPRPSTIQYLNHAAGDRKHQLLTGAKAVIIPSRYETFSVTALEALAYGKPVISFDIPGMSWLSASASLKAVAFDPISLSKQINKLVTDPKLYRQLSVNAQRTAKNYSPARFLSLYRNLIRSLL